MKPRLPTAASPKKNTRSFSNSEKPAQMGTPASRSTARWKLMFTGKNALSGIG